MDTVCPICFDDLYGKVKASPNTCDHIFCLSCLEKWSKLGSFCPVDRKRFKKIVNLESENCIQVKTRKRRKSKVLYDVSSKCEFCLKDNNPEVLLLCDCCDLAYHMFCLQPPLKEVPAGHWFCPSCISVEAKLKRRNGVTKEIEADLGNARLQQLKTEGNTAVKITLTEKKNQKSVEKSVNKGNFVKFNDLGSVQSVDEQGCSIVKQCSVVLSDFENINAAEYSFQGSLSFSSPLRSGNVIKGSSEYMKNVEKSSNCLTYQVESCKNAEPHCSNINNMCHKNETYKDDTLLDVCLPQTVSYKNLKSIAEENLSDVCDISFPSNSTSVNQDQSGKSLKSSLDFTLRIQDKEINSSSTQDSKLHSFKSISNERCSQQSYSRYKSLKQRIRDNVDPRDVSDVNSLPSSSSSSLNVAKGTCNKHLIVTVEDCFKRPCNEITESKLFGGHLKVREKPFSVFEQIEGNDVSQKKYSEMNSRVISFTSNLNVRNCFSCKDIASKNYCKICELKYRKTSTTKKNFQCTKSSNQSQEFEPSRIANTDKNILNMNYKKNSREKRINVVKKRQRSLFHKLKKIHNAQNIFDTQR